MRTFVLPLAVILSVALSGCIGPLSGGADPGAIDPATVRLDTTGLSAAWRATLVPATPYEVSVPTGPMGVPEHVVLSFGEAAGDRPQIGDAVGYIIPRNIYCELHDENQNPAVTSELDVLQRTLTNRRDLASAQLSLLPFEASAAAGAGSLALAAQRKYVDAPWGTGVRFVGVTMQDPSPITNRGLYYVFQGLTDDGAQFVSFLHPVSTDALPTGAEELSPEAMQQIDADYGTYIRSQEQMLDELPDSSWQPELSTLDAVVGSLAFGAYGEEVVPEGESASDE